METKRSRHHSEIQTLRSELGIYRFYVTDKKLRERITAWIEKSTDLHAGTQNAYLQGKFSRLRSDYPMRWRPERTSGEECFPEECSDCEHYGQACPMLTDREIRRARERKLQQAETEGESRSVWMDLHYKTGCERIPEWLEAWEEQYLPLVKEGHELFAECQELTTDATGDREKLPEEQREAVERDDIMSFGPQGGPDNA